MGRSGKLDSTVTSPRKTRSNCSEPITSGLTPRSRQFPTLQLGSCHSEVGASGDPVRGDPEVVDQSKVRHKQRHQSEVDCQLYSIITWFYRPSSARWGVVAACEVMSVRDLISAYQQPVM